MKILFSIAMLWAGMFMSTAQGQVEWVLDDLTGMPDLRIYTQHLNIYHQNQLVLVVTGPNIHDIKETIHWKNLLTSFQENLESVQDQIPEYSIYNIIYQKDYNLIVEEVEGIVRYKVNEGQALFDTKQSKAVLQGQDFEIQVNFEKLADLLEQDYETMIRSAMSQLGKKPGTFKRAYFPKYNYNYSYSKKMMLDENDKIKSKIVFPVNGTIGLYKGKILYEVDAGIGVSLKRQNNPNSQLLYAFLGTLYQYDRELDAMKVGALAGLAWKTNRIGTINIAFPLAPSPNPESPDLIDDVIFRVGTTFQPRNSLSVTLNFYYRRLDDFIPSLAFGFTF